jgi:hypothetical protein
VKALRQVLWLLLLSLLVGLAIGTALRLRLERPVYYLGSALAPERMGQPRLFSGPESAYSNPSLSCATPGWSTAS